MTIEDIGYFCPFCGKPARFLSEEGDVSGNEHTLIECTDCGNGCAIRIGPDVKEWCEEVKEQLK